MRKPRLTITKILHWADAYHDRTGKWPKHNSGPVKENPDDTWSAINSALGAGIRGLPRGWTLARLLEERRGVRNKSHLPRLSIEQILAWADAHREKTGRWPQERSGRVIDAPEETWNAITIALKAGLRGLPRGSSLKRLLAEHRGVRNSRTLPRLTYRQILTWADDYHRRTGQWPTTSSGPVTQEPGTTWSAIQAALWVGARGLPGRTSLVQLLAKYRGVPNRWGKRRTQKLLVAIKRRSHAKRLAIRQILAWADQHHQRTGEWPKAGSGPVRDVPGETWRRIEGALREGSRGLPGGSSLAALLAERRGVRNRGNLPRLTIRQILYWADAHRRHYKEWPHRHSGPVRGVPGETWAAINASLSGGWRGLPRGNTLSRVLAEHRGVRNRWSMGRLTIAQILIWADEHKRRTGAWPRKTSGFVDGASGETWNAVNESLYRGLRGLAGGDSLAQLLARRRGKKRMT